MAKKITVTINITERMLRSALKQADIKIVDKKAFAALFEGKKASKKFAKTLAADMLTLWQEANEEDSDALAIMMGSVAEYDDDGWERTH